MKLLLLLCLSLDALAPKFHGIDPNVHRHGKVVSAGESKREMDAYNKLYGKLTAEVRRGKITKEQWSQRLNDFTKKNFPN